MYKTDIEYTASAKAEGIEGKLKLKLTIGADGSVTDVEVRGRRRAGAGRGRVAAVKQWRFKPAMKCGKPVAGGTFSRRPYVRADRLTTPFRCAVMNSARAVARPLRWRVAA